MVGRPSCDQNRLFFEFELDAAVWGERLVRHVDAVRDLGRLRGELPGIVALEDLLGSCP